MRQRPVVRSVRFDRMQCAIQFGIRLDPLVPEGAVQAERALAASSATAGGDGSTSTVTCDAPPAGEIAPISGAHTGLGALNLAAVSRRKDRQVDRARTGKLAPSDADLLHSGSAVGSGLAPFCAAACR